MKSLSASSSRSTSSGMSWTLVSSSLEVALSSSSAVLYPILRNAEETLSCSPHPQPFRRFVEWPSGSGDAMKLRRKSNLSRKLPPFFVEHEEPVADSEGSCGKGTFRGSSNTFERDVVDSLSKSANTDEATVHAGDIA